MDRLSLYVSAAAGAADTTQRAAEAVMAVKTRRRVDAHRVRAVDLSDPRVPEAMRRRGIGGLPAALAGGRAYVGVRAIEALCLEIQGEAREARVSREAREAPDASPGSGWDGADGADAPGAGADESQDGRDELDAFYRQELLGGGAGIDLETMHAAFDE